MGLSADQQQMIRQMWEFANIVKMGLSADQRQYSMKDGKIRQYRQNGYECRLTSMFRETHKQVVETGSYRQNGSKCDSRSISHQNH